MDGEPLGSQELDELEKLVYVCQQSEATLRAYLVWFLRLRGLYQAARHLHFVPKPLARQLAKFPRHSTLLEWQRIDEESRELEPLDSDLPRHGRRLL